jgi:hypothetical protein
MTRLSSTRLHPPRSNHGQSAALFDAMIELYPDRVNPGSLWGGANAAKREAATAQLRRFRT